jgi:putative transposase
MPWSANGIGRADAFALRQTGNGTMVEEVCRKLGVSEATFYRWKKQLPGWAL